VEDIDLQRRFEGALEELGKGDDRPAPQPPVVNVTVEVPVPSVTIEPAVVNVTVPAAKQNSFVFSVARDADGLIAEVVASPV
jgi:hypothetical protein